MKTEKDDFVISVDGIGSSGKTTQIRLLTEALWEGHNIAAHKIINRELLENALKPLSKEPKEKLWVAYVPNVEIGVDLLAFMALMKQRYHEIKLELGPIPHIILIERYIYDAWMHAATRAVLKEIAGFLKSRNFGPEYLAELIKKESIEKRIDYYDLVEQYKNLGMKKAMPELENLYAVLGPLKKIMKWPNLTLIIDVPIREVKTREVKRENRAYTDGDVIYFSIWPDLYRMLEKREDNVFIIDGTKDEKEISAGILKIVRKKCKLRDYKKR